MKRIRSFTFSSLVLALIASCLGAGMAKAQAWQGEFTLPFEARWGQATLPAGDYSFKVDQAEGAAVISLSSAHKNVALIRAQGHNLKTVDSSSLVIASGRGMNTVRELKLGDLGVVLYFAPSHPRQTAAEEKQMAKVIPVAPGAGR